MERDWNWEQEHGREGKKEEIDDSRQRQNGKREKAIGKWKKKQEEMERTPAASFKFPSNTIRSPEAHFHRNHCTFPFISNNEIN